MMLQKWITVLVACAALFSSTGWAAADRAALFPALEKAAAVTEGAAAPKKVLYVFFDPNCWYCNLTWRALLPYEKVGLQVRWVPVAYQKPSSTGRAAAIMEAPDPAEALRENERRYRPDTYDGGIKPVAKPSPEMLKALQANFDLMKSFGAPATPAVVWKNADGSIGFKNGVPRLSELPKITGLPAQKNDDPALADFR